MVSAAARDKVPLERHTTMSGLDTVIGGKAANPEQVKQHLAEAARLEKAGDRFAAVRELRAAGQRAQLAPAVTLAWQDQRGPQGWVTVKGRAELLLASLLQVWVRARDWPAGRTHRRTRRRKAEPRRRVAPRSAPRSRAGVGASCRPETRGPRHTTA